MIDYVTISAAVAATVSMLVEYAIDPFVPAWQTLPKKQKRGVMWLLTVVTTIGMFVAAQGGALESVGVSPIPSDDLLAAAFRVVGTAVLSIGASEGIHSATKRKQ